MNGPSWRMPSKMTKLEKRFLLLTQQKKQAQNICAISSKTAQVQRNSQTSANISWSCLATTKKKYKDEVPCSVGDAKSGQTSLLFSFWTLCTMETLSRWLSNDHSTSLWSLSSPKCIHRWSCRIYTWHRRLKNVNARRLLGIGRQIPNQIKQIIYQQMSNDHHKPARKIYFYPSDQPAMDRQLSAY